MIRESSEKSGLHRSERGRDATTEAEVRTRASRNEGLPSKRTEERRDLAVAERPDGVRFSVRVKPRASRSAIGGVRDGALEMSIASPPVDGEANAEVVKLLARVLGARQAAVGIVVGESRRTKVVEVLGITVSEARERLGKAAST